ncbi:MAG: hypothetical protein ACYTAS_23485, partial [Planctomycetota bacterium]
ATGTNEIHSRFDVTVLEGLLGLGRGIVGLEPGGRQLLLEQLGLGIVGRRVGDNLLAHGEPTIGHILSSLGDPKRILRMPSLAFGDCPANHVAKLSRIRRVSGQLLRLVAVGQRRLKPAGVKILTTAAEERPGEPADEPLTLAMTPDIIRLSDREGLIKPVVSQRTLSLFDSQDQHFRAPFGYDCR